MLRTEEMEATVFTRDVHVKDEGSSMSARQDCAKKESEDCFARPRVFSELAFPLQYALVCLRRAPHDSHFAEN